MSHYLYNYFIIHFTKPKIIDMITQPNEKYNDILDKISSDNTLPIVRATQEKSDDESVSTNMVDELQNFLNTQIQSQEAH
jgi:hypothetical protein